MNKQTSILVLTLLLSCFAAIGQKMPEDYLEEGNKFAADSQWQKALVNYRYIINEHPRNNCVGLAMYNMGLMYMKIKKTDSAKAVYTRLLQSNLDDMTPIAHGLMDDPYANFKNNASEILSGIYFQEKNYPLALDYLAKSDSIYPYRHFCGNEYAANAIYLALRYAEIYVQLNQKDKAIRVLLSEAIYTGLAKNDTVIAELKKLLKGKKNLKRDMDDAIAKIKGVEIKGKTDDDNYKIYYLDFMGQKIKLPYYFTDSDSNEAGYIARLKQSSLYKMIEELENER